MHSHDITKSQTHTYTHTLTVQGSSMESPRVTDKWVTCTHRRNTSWSHTHSVHTGNIHNLSFTQLTFCNGQEFQIRSQIRNSNHTHEAVMHTQCHTARWTVTYATPVTYTDMAKDTRPPSYTQPSHRPGPIDTM